MSLFCDNNATHRLSLLYSTELVTSKEYLQSYTCIFLAKCWFHNFKLKIIFKMIGFQTQSFYTIRFCNTTFETGYSFKGLQGSLSIAAAHLQQGLGQSIGHSGGNFRGQRTGTGTLSGSDLQQILGISMFSGLSQNLGHST